MVYLVRLCLVLAVGTGLVLGHSGGGSGSSSQRTSQETRHEGKRHETPHLDTLAPRTEDAGGEKTDDRRARSKRVSSLAEETLDTHEEMGKQETPLVNTLAYRTEDAGVQEKTDNRRPRSRRVSSLGGEELDRRVRSRGPSSGEVEMDRRVSSKRRESHDKDDGVPEETSNEIDPEVIRSSVDRGHKERRRSLGKGRESVLQGPARGKGFEPGTGGRRGATKIRHSGGQEGRKGKNDMPKWLEWYNTLPFRQEQLAQYKEDSRPSRSAYGL